MKKQTYLILFVLTISLLVGVSLAGAAEGSGELPTGPGQGQEPVPVYWPDEPGVKPPLVGGEKADRPMVIIDPSALPAPQAVTDTTIDVWYGGDQDFGQLGNPQQWVNIVGNVMATAGTKSLAYTLNNGPEMPLTIGPRNRRLVNEGDFNIELDIADLDNGDNTVKIIATDGNDVVTERNVTVSYTPNVTWDESEEVKWANCSGVQACAQVVDGNWTINGAGKLVLKDLGAAGYDRLVAIGDIGEPASEIWTDYEVTVPITVKGLLQNGFDAEGSGPGIGIMTRWQGHTLRGNEQPRLDWQRLGALGWYVWNEQDGDEGLSLIGYRWNGGTSTSKVWQFNTQYLMKMSVQSASKLTLDPTDQRAYFRLKIWKQGDPEPVAWDVESYSPKNTQAPLPQSGSVVLISHYVDAEFGDVSIVPLADLSYNLQTSVEGNGSITKDPSVGEDYDFSYGETVRLTAVPQPNNILDRWEFDDGSTLPGTRDKLVLSMTSDVSVKAVFKEAAPGSINVDIVGQGQVTKDPDKQVYDPGEIVTVTAVPSPGWFFQQWGGDLAGNLARETLRIDGDRNVTATFAEASTVSPLSDDFSQCALDTNVWSFVNPSGDGTYEMTGTSIRMSVPAGAEHTIWRDNRDAPRIMQATEDGDFTVVLKFETIPTERFQIQGFLAEQDEDNWVRFDFNHDGSALKMFAGKAVDGKTSSVSNTTINPGAVTELYMRVRRVGDLWTQAYSVDGSTWLSEQTLSQALTVVSSGVFVGNQPGVTSPAYTSEIDYFLNTAFPFDDEDGTPGASLVINTDGQGFVEQSPPAPNEQNRYACGQEVSLTAIPASGWSFGGWSGDASGLNAKITVVMDRNREVTASFVEGAVQLFGYLPIVVSQ